MGIPGLAAVHVKSNWVFLLTTASLWGINGMWLIKTKARAILDHSDKSHVQIRGWQVSPVLVGSRRSSIFTSRHPFRCWNMAPLTHFYEEMFSYTPSPSCVLAYSKSSVLNWDKRALSSYAARLQSSDVTWTRSLTELSVLPALCQLILLLQSPLTRDAGLNLGVMKWPEIWLTALLPQSQHNPLSVNQAVLPTSLSFVPGLQDTSLANLL